MQPVWTTFRSKNLNMHKKKQYMLGRRLPSSLQLHIVQCRSCSFGGNSSSSSSSSGSPWITDATQAAKTAGSNLLFPKTAGSNFWFIKTASSVWIFIKNLICQQNLFCFWCSLENCTIQLWSAKLSLQSYSSSWPGSDEAWQRRWRCRRRLATRTARLVNFHTLTFTLSLSHSHFHTYIFTLSLSHFHTLTFTLTFPHSHFHTLTFTLSLSHFHFHNFTFTFTLSLQDFHFHNFTFTLSLLPLCLASERWGESGELL